MYAFKSLYVDHGGRITSPIMSDVTWHDGKLDYECRCKVKDCRCNTCLRKKETLGDKPPWESPIHNCGIWITFDAAQAKRYGGLPFLVSMEGKSVLHERGVRCFGTVHLEAVVGIGTSHSQHIARITHLPRISIDDAKRLVNKSREEFEQS